jgi:hypothetical protein
MELDLDNLTRDHLANLFGCSEKTIDNYTKLKEDPLPYKSRGKFKAYVWSDVFKWKLKQVIQKAPARDFTEKDNLEAAKLEGQNLKNEREKLELDARKGELLEVNDVRQTWSDSLAEIKQALRNAGHTAAESITSDMTYGKKKEIIDSLIFKNLAEVIEKTSEVSS